MNCQIIRWDARPRPSVLTLAVFFGFAVSTAAIAAPLDIAQIPPALGQVLPPNILYIQDDSGSMTWAYMPDANSNSSYKRFTSNTWNAVYFDPNVQYLPPLDHLGNSLGDSDFTNAWENGYLSNRNSYRRNLGTNYRVTTTVEGTLVTTSSSWSAQAAFYHEFAPPQSGCSGVGSVTNDSCYVKRTVTATQRQNFANWYSYYRTREMTAKAGISRAFAELGDGARIGYGRINKSSASTIDGKSVSTVVRGVRQFRDDPDFPANNYRKQFFDWLFALNSTGGTPLRRALDAAGQYYKNDNTNGPWSTTPGEPDGNRLACRKSFTILMTDGYWNDAQASTAAARNNNDGTEGNPFADSASNTLADVAMYYWKNDLVSNLEDRVAPTTRDPATWQHMTTYTIGLGVEPTGIKSGGSTITSDVKETVFSALDNPSAPTITWPTPGESSSNNIADLMHAALNGRGDFFSARNPEEFASAMKNALASIADQVGAIAPLGQSSSSSTADTMLYQAKFDTDDWSGWLTATPFDPNTGQLAAISAWTSSVPKHSSRNILTYNPEVGGTEFLWDNISGAQQALLNNAELGLPPQGVLNWVRGNQSEEQPAGSFRKRSSAGLIGDIVNSKPLYVGARNEGYGFLTGIPATQRTTYISRINSDTFKQRKRIVYVGANDGMLHAFNTGTYQDDGDGIYEPSDDFNNGDGVETFAYVPAAVYANLPALAHSEYLDHHRYFVDGSPTAGDAYIGGEWKTVLVGSTGAGGRSYFALDIEAPDSMNAGKVLWEFTHGELGVAIGQATIARVGNAISGRWVAIFGNGYNSTAQRAQLFIVDLRNGNLIKNIDTGVGSEALPNGMGPPQVVDINLDGNADLVYAGDYRGNLWKIDLSTNDPENWKVSFEGKPLFKATDSAGKSQPITARPTVRRHPKGGLVVYFGTGKLLLTGDQGDLSEQTLYGIFDLCGKNSADDCGTTSGVEGVIKSQRVLKAELIEQKIYEEGTHNFGGESVASQHYRFITQNSLANRLGFFINLLPPDTDADSGQGERVVGPANISFSDRVIFTTMIPNEDPCEQGADGWIMELDPFSGGRTDFSVFDMNADSFFNSNDTKGKTVVSGRKTPGGATPAVLHGPDKSYKIGTQAGANQSIANKPDPNLVNRQSWQQIR